MKARLKLGLILLLVGCLVIVGLSTVSANDNNTIGDFTELNNLIQNNNVINLNKDYNATDKTFYKGITISNGMNITINGNGHTIDGNYQGRIFDIKKGGTLTLNNVKIINGNVSGNGANNGGAIYNNEGATLNINNCTFSNNQAKNYGGAIYSEDKIICKNSYFINNKANYNRGGAIYYESMITFQLNFNNCTFIKNYANDYGGAICVFGSPHTYLNIDNCTFNDNYAKGCGGAISSDSDINCYNSTFIKNHSEKEGGAIYLGNSGDNYLIHNIFINNGAGKGRGGFNVYNYGYYKIIEFNYFPNEEQNKFMKYRNIIKNDINYHDSHPYYNLTDYYNHGKIFVGNFNELNYLIQNNNVINLNTDYKATDKIFYKGITISNGMNVTINGNGHTIDGNYQGRIFDIKTGGTLTLNNVKLINGNVSGNGASYGGAIYINKDATLNINNCVFNNNFANGKGNAIYNTGTLIINNTLFDNENARDTNAIVTNNGLTTYKINYYTNGFTSSESMTEPDENNTTTAIPVELVTTNAFAKNNVNEIAYVAGSFISDIPLQ